MQELNFPLFPFKIKSAEAKQQIFDAFRRKWVALTPEEWVRQHVLEYLRQEKSYPASLTSVEFPLELNGLKKRCDIVYFRNSGKPLMIVECKAPSVAIEQTVFDQAVRYNLVLGVRYLFLTNGLKHVIARMEENGTVNFLNEVPVFIPGP